MAFGVILRELREENSLSQKQLAETCNLSTQCISALETGARNPTGSTIRVLSQFFQVSSDYLLELEDDFGVKVDGQGKKPDTLSPDERKLLKGYRTINAAGKKLVMQTVETLQATAAGDKNKSDEQAG